MCSLFDRGASTQAGLAGGSKAFPPDEGSPGGEGPGLLRDSGMATEARGPWGGKGARGLRGR